MPTVFFSSDCCCCCAVLFCLPECDFCERKQYSCGARAVSINKLCAVTRCQGVCCNLNSTIDPTESSKATEKKHTHTQTHSFNSHYVYEK